MPCKNWNNDWVAHCYGELDPATESRLNAHLESCAECRETLASLADSRRLLQEAAPAVPDAPRLVVLQAARTRHPVRTFAGGVAAALLLFAAGIVAASALGIGGAGDESAVTDRLAANIARNAELLQRIEVAQIRFDNELAASRVTPASRPETMQAGLSEEQFLDEMTRFEYRLNNARAKDRDFLLGEINAAELRAGFQINDTRQALRHVMLASNPALTEQ